MSGKAESGWTIASLGEVADIRVSNVDKKSRPGQRKVRLCNYMDVYREDYLADSHPFMMATASESEVGRFGLQAGDVLITKDSETPIDIGVPATIVGEVHDLVCGYHLAILRPSSRLNSVWLAKVLAHEGARTYFACRATGSTRYGLANSTIAEMPLLVPTRKEQDRAAEAFVAADEAIRRSEALLAKLEQVKAGLLHDLLTRGLDKIGCLRDPEAHPEQFQDSPLGRIPREWEVAQVQELGQLITGNTPATSRSDYYGGDIPFVTPGDLGRLRCIHDSASSLTIAGSGVARMVPIGAVLITCIGVLGKVGLAARPLAVNQQINCLVPSPHLDSSYAYWACLRLKPQLDTVSTFAILPRGSDLRILFAC